MGALTPAVIVVSVALASSAIGWPLARKRCGRFVPIVAGAMIRIAAYLAVGFVLAKVGIVPIGDP